MMLKVAQEGQLFGGRVPSQLHGPVWPCDASFVARIHADETFDLSITAELLHEAFGYEPSTLPYGARRNVSPLAWPQDPGAPLRVLSHACCVDWHTVQ